MKPGFHTTIYMSSRIYSITVKRRSQMKQQIPNTKTSMLVIKQIKNGKAKTMKHFQS